MTIAEALESLSHYPIPDSVIHAACAERGIDPNGNFDSDIATESGYKLAKADCYKWLVYAPSSISENGVSFQLTAEQKTNYRMFANEIYKEYHEKKLPTLYGYKGSSF